MPAYFLASHDSVTTPHSFPHDHYSYPAEKVVEPVVHENVACKHCKVRWICIAEGQTEAGTGQEYRRHLAQMHRVSHLSNTRCGVSPP